MHNRTLGLLLALPIIGAATTTPAAQPAKSPIPARTVTIDRQNGTLAEVAADLGKQAGIPVELGAGLGKEPCPAKFAGTPFWAALEEVARRTNTRIDHRDGGRVIVLERKEKGDNPVSSVAGPFRTVARMVTAKKYLDIGTTFYDVELELQWEPRFPVFRLDSHPRITKAADDRGTALEARAGTANNAVTGYTHSGSVRLTGLTRESRTIRTLAGSFTVTAAESMLAFRFPDLTAKQPSALPAKQGVTATLKRFERDEKTWEAEIELLYPEGMPAFESFEAASWLTQNRLRLVSPDGSKVFAPDDYEIPQAGRRVVAVYRFKEDAAKGLANPNAKGWSLVYETPSPLVEFRVPFELTDIPLP